MPQKMIPADELDLIQNDKKFEIKLQELKAQGQRLIQVINLLWLNVLPAPSVSEGTSRTNKHVTLNIPAPNSRSGTAPKNKRHIPAYIRLYLQTPTKHPKRKVPSEPKHLESLPTKKHSLTSATPRLLAPLSRPSPISSKPLVTSRLRQALAQANQVSPSLLSEQPIDENSSLVRTRR